MKHTGPGLPAAMQAEWNRKLVQRRARRAIQAIASASPQPGVLRVVTRTEDVA